jgi:ribosome maturation factor RimP
MLRESLTKLLQPVIEAQGYDLWELEYAPGRGNAVLRIYLDTANHAGITVEDCEAVSREVSALLDVHDPIEANYTLEVSSPGLDRPLKKAADYARFAGEQVEVTLKMPFKGRKKYTGELQALGSGENAGWRLVLVDQKQTATRATKRAAAQALEQAPADADAGGDLALDFSLDEVREARLVPVVDFKGRRFAAPLETAAPAGTGPTIEVDGGRIQ